MSPTSLGLNPRPTKKNCNKETVSRTITKGEREGKGAGGGGGGSNQFYSRKAPILMQLILLPADLSRTAVWVANSADPVQTSGSVASD